MLIPPTTDPSPEGPLLFLLADRTGRVRDSVVGLFERDMVNQNSSNSLLKSISVILKWFRVMEPPKVVSRPPESAKTVRKYQF